MALKGVVIDAGHGGIDKGASANNIIEKDLNLMISNYMADRLKSLSIPYKMTRTTDETLDANDRTDRILSFFGNDKDVLVISNHINAGGGDGAEVIYALRNNDKFSKMILDELEKEGQNIRKAYQQRLPSNPIKDYYFIHRNTPNTEAVIVEYGFLDSKGDDILDLKNKYKEYAEAVIRAICKYKGITYKAPYGSNFYTVQKGDTLYSIASKFGISVNELKKINNLSSNIINIGDNLKVKLENEKNLEDYVLYTVKKGDTLYGIAKEYNTTIDTLMDINNLNNANLVINEQLLIPKEVNSNKTGINYVVVKGDTLYSIANKYKLSVDSIKKANNLASNIINIGDVLLLPGTESYQTYTVKEGDTLYKIASLYGISVNELMKINNLEGSYIYKGQSLLLPTK